METKSIQITPPEGYEVDKEHSTFEKIVFKPIDSKPRSWEEYWKQQDRKNETGYFIDLNSDICKCHWGDCDYNSLYMWRNVIPSKELAEAFLALMQLISLRHAWIGDWDSNRLGYAIMLDVERNIIVSHNVHHTPLTFPERKLALEFKNCFKDLLEQAKPLL